MGNFPAVVAVVHRESAQLTRRHPIQDRRKDLVDHLHNMGMQESACLLGSRP